MQSWNLGRRQPWEVKVTSFTYWGVRMPSNNEEPISGFEQLEWGQVSVGP